MSSSLDPALKSSLPAVAAAGTNCRSPSPPAVSPRLSRNCTDCATISTLERFEPSCASHEDQSSRPSTPIRRPLERCMFSVSAWLPKTLTSKKFGLSIQLPASSF